MAPGLLGGWTFCGNAGARGASKCPKRRSLGTALRSSVPTRSSAVALRPGISLLVPAVGGGGRPFARGGTGGRPGGLVAYAGAGTQAVAAGAGRRLAEPAGCPNKKNTAPGWLALAGHPRGTGLAEESPRLPGGHGLGGPHPLAEQGIRAEPAGPAWLRAAAFGLWPYRSGTARPPPGTPVNRQPWLVNRRRGGLVVFRLGYHRAVFGASLGRRPMLGPPSGGSNEAAGLKAASVVQQAAPAALTSAAQPTAAAATNGGGGGGGMGDCLGANQPSLGHPIKKGTGPPPKNPFAN